jgi:acyl transferase domain-containing protein
VRARQLASGQFGEPFDPAQAIAASSRFGPVRSYSLPGSLQSMCATNLSQVFDFRGPAFTIDSACASSLTAVVQAVHYLRSAPEGGPAPVALAGGIFMMMVPDALVGFSRIGAVAAHECRPFDSDSSGFLMGEGGGVVILKRLSDALRDGNPVYAILRGVAWNSDGRADNPMTVGLEGHSQLIELGLRDCGLQLNDFGYVECHGTATRTGDTVELQSLAHHLKGSNRPFLGSIKANIGHTMSAAGVAGLLRAVLALHHREIPPQANWNAWHPDLNALQDRFRIPTGVEPWDQPLPRALVSSFGFGGTNALVALQAPDQPARAVARPLPGPRPTYRPYKADEAEPESDIRLPPGPGVLHRLARLELDPPFLLEDLDLDGGRARRTLGRVPPRVGEPSGLGIASELDALLPPSVRPVRFGCCEALGDEPLQLHLSGQGAHLFRRGRLAAWLEFEPNTSAI